jgi:hypothetical protein
MAQIVTKFIKNLAVTSAKIGSLSATSAQALFADGSGNAAFRSILVGDIPTLNQNTTGTAANITATSNNTLTTLSALTTAASLAISGSQVSGGTFGAVNGSALTNLSAAALSGVLPVGVTGGSGLSIATSQLTGTISLTSQVSGILPIADGGTNASSAAAAFANLSPMTTAGDVIYENATPAPARLGIGSTGQILTVVGGLPAWATPATSGTVTSVALADGSSSPIYSISGSPVTGSGTLTFSLQNQAVHSVFAGPSSGGSAQPTFRALVAGDIPSLSSVYLALSGGTMSGAINMGANQINNIANGTATTDAINLGQLQAAISGLYWQGPAKAYANSNVPLTGASTLTIDGYSVQNGDLVILGNQTTASQNGEYSASGIGTAYVLTANGLPTAAGDAWLILNGTVYGDSAFVANAAVPAATFTEFAGPTAYIFSAPLNLSGRTVSITLASGSSNGYLSSTDWNTFNNKQAAGNYITALTGDAAASGPGSAALTLATVNSNVGSFGSSTSIPSFTVNAKGLITAASGNAVVAPAGTLSGTTLNSSVVSSSLTSVGTISSGTWNGTTIAIANGGTGQTSASAAFNALSPMTTAGDIIYENSTPSGTRLGIGSTGQILTVVGGLPAWATPATSGTVTSVSVVSANGFAGTVATATSTPAITISTSITGVLKGNGTAISAATAGTDYSAGTSALATGILKSTTTTGALTIAIAADFPTLNQNTTGNAATVTTNANLTGPITSSGNATSVAAQTGTGSTFVMQATPTLTTPNIGAATGTSLSVSGSLTSTVATGTAPLVVTSTTNVANLNASSLSGATFASPGPIGSGTASTGAFTTLSASSTVTFSGTTTNIAATSQTSGTITFGGTAGTGALTFGSSTATQTTNIATGVTAAASTKTVNIGTSSAASSTTTIAIGSTSGTSTTTMNGTVTLANALAVTSGGTGSASALTQWGVKYAASTTAEATTAAGTAGYALVANSSAAPTFQQISLTAGVTGTLPIGNGGTGVTSATTTPTASAFAAWDANKNLSANNIINGYTTTATAAGTTTLTVGSTGQQYFTGSTTQTVVLPVAATLVNGFQFVIVNNSSGTVTVQTSGSNVVQAMGAMTQLVITCTNTAGGTGTASWSWIYSTEASGTVTSVALADSTGLFNISGSPVTSSGTLTLSSFQSQAQHAFFAGPSGASGAPTFRAIVASDIPTLNQNTTGSAASFTGSLAGDITGTQGATVLSATSNGTLATLSALTTASSLSSIGTVTTGTWNATTIAIAHGGTGQTTAAAAFAALSPMTTAGDIIYENATPAPARLGIGSTGQVLTVVGGLPAWSAASTSATATEDIDTLASGDITNQYVDLLHVAQGASSTVNSVRLSVVGGPEQLKGTDYTVSLTGGAGGVTRITFAGDLATSGNAALVSGDILMISYSY